MKIKNGDKVRLKDNLVVGERYDGIIYLDIMARFEDKIFTAIEVDEKNRTCRMLDSSPFTYSFEMLELIECCTHEIEYSQKALENFFNKAIYSSDNDSCNDCIINNLYMKCNTDTCMIISTLNVLKRNNLLDLDRFNDVFGYNDNDKEGDNDNE